MRDDEVPGAGVVEYVLVCVVALGEERDGAALSPAWLEGLACL